MKQTCSILLATGIPTIDQNIEELLHDRFLIGKRCYYTDYLLTMIQERQPDCVIVSEFLSGKISVPDILHTISTSFPKTKILVLFKEEIVYDEFDHYLSGQFSAKDIESNLALLPI